MIGYGTKEQVERWVFGSDGLDNGFCSQHGGRLVGRRCDRWRTAGFDRRSARSLVFSLWRLLANLRENRFGKDRFDHGDLNSERCRFRGKRFGKTFYGEFGGIIDTPAR